MNDFLASVGSIKDAASMGLEIIGILSLILLIFGSLSRLGKAMWRFGLALYGKKIMVVAGDDDYSDLEEDLCDSGLIKQRNIQRVSNKHQAKTKDALLLLVVYGYLKPCELEKVVNGKSARCGLIVYCPPEKGRIDANEMELLSKASFTAICNFRGRLVNDVLLMMLSTSFKRTDLK